MSHLKIEDKNGRQWTVKEISEEFGISRSTIWSRLKSKSFKTFDEITAPSTSYSRQWTIKEISEKFGISGSTIWSYINSENLQSFDEIISKLQDLQKIEGERKR